MSRAGDGGAAGAGCGRGSSATAEMSREGSAPPLHAARRGQRQGGCTAGLSLMRTCIICRLESTVLMSAAAQGHGGVHGPGAGLPGTHPAARRTAALPGVRGAPRSPSHRGRTAEVRGFPSRKGKGSGEVEAALVFCKTSCAQPDACRNVRGRRCPAAPARPPRVLPVPALPWGEAGEVLVLSPGCSPAENPEILPERPRCALCFLATCRGGRPGAGWSWKGDGRSGPEALSGSDDVRGLIHSHPPFSSCFSPSASFLRANPAAWGLSPRGWGCTEVAGGYKRHRL